MHAFWRAVIVNGTIFITRIFISRHTKSATFDLKWKKNRNKNTCLWTHWYLCITVTKTGFCVFSKILLFFSLVLLFFPVNVMFSSSFVNQMAYCYCWFRRVFGNKPKCCCDRKIQRKSRRRRKKSIRFNDAFAYHTIFAKDVNDLWKEIGIRKIKIIILKESNRIRNWVITNFNQNENYFQLKVYWTTWFARENLSQWQRILANNKRIFADSEWKGETQNIQTKQQQRNNK